MDSTESAVSVDGFPYVAASPGCPEITAWEPAEDEPRGASVFRDTLASARFVIEERLRLAEGDLEANGLTFDLHDLEAADGIAEGHPWMTWLSTRDPRDVPSAVVSASFDADDTAFFLSTDSASAVAASIPGVLWVDAEAILCSAINLGTGEVTVDTDGRGYYGSRATSHLVDEEYSTYPEAWTAPPWATQRRVVLWRVGSDGVARVRWRGYAHRAPRTSAQNRAVMQLQCDHAWTVERARPLGDRAGSTRLRGYNAAGLILRCVDPSGAWVGAARMASWNYAAGYSTIYDTLDELLTDARRALAQTISTYTGVDRVAVQAPRQGRTVRVRAEIQGPSAKFYLATQVLGEVTAGAVGQGDPQRLEVSCEAPEVAVVLDAGETGTGSSTVPVTSAAGLPTSAASVITQTIGSHRITVRQVLAGDYDDETRLVIAQPAATAFDATYTGPIVTGFASLRSRETGRAKPQRKGVAGLTGDADNHARTRVVTIDRAVHLGLSTEVTCTHWVHGLWALVTYGERTGCRVDPRNWGLEESDREAVAVATEGDLAARTWLFEGAGSLGAFLTPTLAAEGCVPVLRALGRVSVVALGHPALTDEPVASFTSDDTHKRTGFEWAPLPEALTNVAAVKVDDETTTVRDSRSAQRYGETQARGLEIAGLPPSTTAADPRSVAGRVLSRLVQVWGDPVALVRWRVPLGAGFDGVYLADLVELTDRVAPNGQGGRGMTARRAVIVARTEDDQAGVMTFEAVTFPHCYGYAPAIRVLSIVDDVLAADQQYVLEDGLDATDYAGAGGLARGVRDFAAGYRVKLRLRDSVVDDYYPAVIASTNPTAGSGGTITFTAPVPTTPTDWPSEAAAGRVDCVFDDFETAGIADAQKRYAVCGSGTSAFGSIGSSGEVSRRWAP